MSSRFVPTLIRIAVIVVAMVAGTTLAALPQPVSASERAQLSTCVTLATGATRVLIRGACDPVLEMPHGWGAVSVDEPAGRLFSARTLAQAVVLNTGGDSSRFTRMDWANIARLDAANRAAASPAPNAEPGSGEVVRVITTTCVNDQTGVARVLVSGDCDGRTESRQSWVSVDPLQMPVGANEREQLWTCVTLATGATRVLIRGACDPVLEMPHGWGAVSVDEPAGRLFSARTLAQAVVLNTGGDSSRFTRMDWANIARLDAANRAAASPAPNAEPGSGEVVRVITTTCVNDQTGVARVLVSGGCDGPTESRQRWVSVEPLQKPVIANGAPGIPQIVGVRVVDDTSRTVTFEAPEDEGSSPITSMTVVAMPGGQSVTIQGGAGGTALFTGLTPGAKYTFLVVALNGSGAGPRIPTQVPAPGPVPNSLPNPTPSSVPSEAPAGGTGFGGGGASAPVVAPSTLGAPTVVVATAGNTQATVTFTAPLATGGVPVSSYTVTASPGGATGTGTSSPIIVTGLANGTSYTFAVTATNSTGTSAASVASISTTPQTTQVITLANPGTLTLGTTPTLTATSDAGLTVTLASSTPSVCTITTGGLLAFTSTGTCTISANQAGNAATLAAPQITATFTIAL